MTVGPRPLGLRQPRYQAETSDNVQQFSQRIYPVLSEAKACSVSATVVLPIFADAQRAKAVAVLELFQFNGPGFGYKTVFDWANRHLRVQTPAKLLAPSALRCFSYSRSQTAMIITAEQRYQRGYQDLNSVCSGGRPVYSWHGDTGL